MKTLNNLFNTLLLIFLLTFFAPNSGFSQSGKNILKATGGASIVPYELQYERSIAPNISVIVGLGLGSSAKSEVLGVVTNYKGMGFSAEGRYYFSTNKDLMEGWHIGLYYEMAQLKADELKVNFSTIGLGGGYQFILNKFAIDLDAGIGTFHVGGSESELNILNIIPIAPRLEMSLGYSF